MVSHLSKSEARRLAPKPLVDLVPYPIVLIYTFYVTECSPVDWQVLICLFQEGRVVSYLYVYIMNGHGDLLVNTDNKRH
jgi:hypothetical protein